MSALTVSVVSSWRPELLCDAADRLLGAARTTEHQAVVVRRSLGAAVAVGGGAWASTAESRAWQESRTGLGLADGLAAAAALLRSGAADLTRCRDRLVERVALARATGCVVGEDGSVSPSGAMPPLDTMGAQLEPDQDQQEGRRADEAAAHAEQIRVALADAAAADAALARSLMEVELPESLPSAVAAWLRRTSVLGDPVAALGTIGGAVALGHTAREAHALTTRTRALAGYLRAAGTGRPADAALRAFTQGTASHPALKLAGRAFLPLTVVTGAGDAVTGAGHDGSRGWATRGFGAAGAVGAGALLGSSLGLVALGPAGVAIAGGAVLAYGAWSAGSYVVDHWDQVADLHDAAVTWAGEQGGAAAGEVVDAVAWAHDQLAGAGDSIGEAGSEALDLVRSLW